MNALIAFFARKGLIGDLFSIFVVVGGLLSLGALRRDAFPNVVFDIVTVTTVFPGASPEEVEKLVTTPLEQDLKEVDGIKKLTSTSIEGRSLIVVQLDPDQTTEAVAKADVEEIVSRFEEPEGSQEPTVSSLQSKYTPIIEVTVGGPIPEVELRRIAKAVSDDLENLPGVARVVARGLRDLEIRVEADPLRLARYRLSLEEVIGALQRRNVSISAGVLEPPARGGVASDPVGGVAPQGRVGVAPEARGGVAPQGRGGVDPKGRGGVDPKGRGGVEKIVRTIGEFRDVADVEATVIRANELGTPIRVRDVAKVFQTLEKASILHRTSGESSVGLTVLKKEKADAIEMVDQVRLRVAELEKRYAPTGVSFKLVNDMSFFIRRRLGVLTGNLAYGLGLVFLSMLLLLPFRVAVLVAMGDVVSFMGAFLLFYFADQSINLISLMGFIVVSGMLVDDAIVVTDNTLRHLEEGEPPEKAAVVGAQEVWKPVTASAMTTVVSFLPLMFMSGIFGKFIWQIPLAVLTTLAVSLFEVFFILPAHVAHYIRVEKKGARRGPLAWITARTARIWDTRVVPAYLRYLRGAIRFRYLFGFAMTLFFFGSIAFAALKMKFILFTADGIEIFFVRADSPIGTSLEQTRDSLLPVEKLVKKLPPGELDEIVTTVGIQQQDPHDPLTRRGSEYAQIAVYLTPETSRARSASEIIEDLRTRAGNQSAFERLVFARVNPGPPTGKPVDISVRGKDYPTILPAVEEVKRILATVPGVSDVADSYILGKRELRVEVDPVEAAAAGLSTAAIGASVRAAFEGVVATQIRELDDEIDVRVSLTRSARSRASTLGEIDIPSPTGHLIPLKQVARVTETQGLAMYQHKGGEREVRVQGELDQKVSSANEANGVVAARLPELLKKFPNVKFDFGGESQDTRESMESLARSFGIAVALVMLILVATFQNLLQPLLVALTIPMGILSVIWAFFLHGRPLTFLTMIGVIALSGVIVNNAIVLIDFINQRRAQGAGDLESILDAARVRVRPIFLTTISTIVGLMPTAYGIGGYDPFVVPVALSLGWGLALGSVMTAFLFPVTVAILDDVRHGLARVGGRMRRRRA